MTYIPGGGGGGTTTNALTIDNGGAGAASGATFNGSAAVTISYNTVGAQVAGSYLSGNQTITLSGDLTGSGATSISATIANDAVTYAKLQNVSATSRLLGRKTASSGDTEECTLSEVLDFVGSAAQGDILYRGAATWTRLGAGTSGQFLKTQGAGANPTWASAGGWTQIAALTSITNPSAQLDVSGLSGYSEILFIARNVTTSSAGFRVVQAGKSGTFYSSSGDYKGVATAGGAESNAGDWGGNGSSTSAAVTVVTRIVNNVSGGVPVSYQAASVPILFVAVAAPIDSIRFKNTAGNLTGGTYEVWGRA